MYVSGLETLASASYLEENNVDDSNIFGDVLLLLNKFIHPEYLILDSLRTLPLLTCRP